MKSASFAVMAFVIGAALPAVAQQAQPAPETLRSGLSTWYALQASYQSAVGPGLFLQKGESFDLCFALETPNSTGLKTQYCRAVH